MEYITVANGIITGHFCGDSIPDGAIQVPDMFPGWEGLSLSALTDDYKSVKSLSQQISEGIINIPEGYKLDPSKSSFVRMTNEELNSAYPAQIWATPDTYQEIKVYKEFKDDILGYYPPENTVKMFGSQPYPYYKANKNGIWEIDKTKQEEYNLSESKKERANSVSKITITVDGMTFDGDEVSQERMARTITVAKASNEPDSSTVMWVLADNTIATPTIAQLTKALRLAGEEQTKLWIVPYTKI